MGRASAILVRLRQRCKAWRISAWQRSPESARAPALYYPVLAEVAGPMLLYEIILSETARAHAIWRIMRHPSFAWQHRQS